MDLDFCQLFGLYCPVPYRSCEKSVDNSARNLLAAERELGRIQAVLDAIADNVSKLSQSTARVNIKPVE